MQFIKQKCPVRILLMITLLYFNYFTSSKEELMIIINFSRSYHCRGEFDEF